MKLLSLMWLMLISINCFSQKTDSLAVLYRIGYKCSPEIDGEEKKGVCGRKEEITYENKKRAYRIRSLECKESFREWGGNWEVTQDSVTKTEVKNWVGGFGSNLIKDSMSHPNVFKNKRIAGKDLDVFLLSIISIKADTVFSYTMKEVPASYLEKHFPAHQSDKKKVDSLLQDEFSIVAMSNVTGYLFLSFRYKGISYELCKDSNNVYWNLYVDDTDQSINFIHFAFDAFLRRELPRKFSGLKVFN